MKIKYNKNYLTLSNEIEQFVNNFNTSGKLIGDGDRNKIKTYPIGNINISIKSFKVPHFINKIIYRYFRKSKAERSFTFAQELIKKGILTPRPIAFFENYNLIGLTDSYYICEYLTYDLTFRDLVQKSDYPDHKNILQQFTKFTWQMHEQGVFFKDHSPGNTLIVKNDNNYDFYLVDLNRMSFFELEFKTRMKNFSRLTPKKEMVEIMSETYAQLSGEKVEKVFENMWFYTQDFQKKFHRKKEIKKRLLGKK